MRKSNTFLRLMKRLLMFLFCRRLISPRLVELVFQVLPLCEA